MPGNGVMFPWLNVKTQNPSFFRNGAPACQAKAWVVKVGLTMTTGRGFSAVGLQWKSFAPGGGTSGLSEATTPARKSNGTGSGPYSVFGGDTEDVDPG